MECLSNVIRGVAKRPLPWLFVLSSWLVTRRGNQDETETTKILNHPSIQQWVDILCKIKRKLYNIKNPRKAICTRCHSKYPYSSKLCWEDLLFLSIVVSSQWKYFLLFESSLKYQTGFSLEFATNTVDISLALFTVQGQSKTGYGKKYSKIYEPLCFLWILQCTSVLLLCALNGQFHAQTISLIRFRRCVHTNHILAAKKEIIYNRIFGLQ